LAVLPITTEGLCDTLC